YLANFAASSLGSKQGAPGGASAAGSSPVDACVDLYIALKAEAEARLTDGAGQKPAYSMRTLCRALDYARCSAPKYGLQRALYDGFAMAFSTQ
ncbi:VWFA domain-containing protein, partial [Haematococcus lacustris]